MKIKIGLLVFLCGFILNPRIFCQVTIEVGGTITSNTTWSADFVKVTSNITIQNGVTLIINPGTIVEFQGHYKIDVNGRILAEGQEGDTIYFKPKDPVAGWLGINLWTQSSEENYSRFDFCKFTYVYDDSPSTAFGGTINVYNNSFVTISNCHITKGRHINSMALYTYSSDIIIKNSTINFNDGNGIYCEGSKITVEYCYICNNKWDGFQLRNSDAIISNCIISNNFDNTSAYGVNLINSDAVITNCIISYNYIGLMIDRSVPVITNCIIWANQYHQIYILDNGTIVKLNNCILQHSLSGVKLPESGLFKGTYLNCINQDPLFLDPPDGISMSYDGTKANWHLPYNSPGINSGAENTGISYPALDLDGNSRISHGIIDMGPYEYHNEMHTAENIISSDIYWIADTVKVYNDVSINDGAKLIIAPGTYVEMQGYYQFTNNGCIYAKGTETARITFAVRDSSGLSNISSTSGSWRGFNFDIYSAGNDTSLFKYCNFLSVKNIGTFEYGVFYVFIWSPLIIDNCLFKNNYGQYGGAAVAVEVCGPILTNNEICCNYSWGQYTRGTIYTHNAGTPIIRGNYFHHNKTRGISCQNSCVIENNIIEYNTDYQGSAINVTFSEPIIRNNIIRNNYGVSVYITSNSEPLFVNNIICNNTGSESAAVYIMENNDPVFINNTITNNKTSSNYGIYVGNRCNAIFINNILWGNKSTGSFWDIYINGTNFTEIRNCLITNGINGISDWSGVISDILDGDPHFAVPTSDAGADFNAANADWSPLSISPAIDAGLIDPAGFILPLTDIKGNNRINNQKIDLGAIENSSSALSIIKQPVNRIKCEYESTIFEVVLSDTACYQWQKDEVDISGANKPVYTLNNISMNDQGNYQCIIKNSYGNAISNPAYLMVIEKPEFILSPPDILWTESDKDITLRTFVKGTSPSFQWYKNGIAIPDEVTPELLLKKISNEDEGTYKCIIQNSCASDTCNPSTLYLAPQICMVTVSTLTGNNLVVWEKNTIAPIAEYKIYRESKYAGIYDLIATLPYDDMSIYVDSTADPTVQAYLYKITAVDTSGYETDISLSRIHKTIHLLATVNPETQATQLDWDRYVGFDFGTYEIFRSETTANFTSIHAMASSTSTWTDTETETGLRYYRVAALRPEMCYPSGNSGKKADSGPYSHSMSNIEDNRFQTGISEHLLNREKLVIYPNPLTESATLLFSNDENFSYTLYIIDLSGKVLRTVEDINTSEYVLEKGDLEKGFYFIELRGPKSFRDKILIE